MLFSTTCAYEAERGRGDRLAAIPRALESGLEVEIRGELDQPRIEHAERLAIERERAVLRRHGIGVERVEQIHVQRRAHAAEAQNLANAEVELVEPIAELGVRGDDVHLC